MPAADCSSICQGCQASSTTAVPRQMNKLYSFHHFFVFTWFVPYRRLQTVALCNPAHAESTVTLPILRALSQQSGAHTHVLTTAVIHTPLLVCSCKQDPHNNQQTFQVAALLKSTNLEDFLTASFAHHDTKWALILQSPHPSLSAPCAAAPSFRSCSALTSAAGYTCALLCSGALPVVGSSNASSRQDSYNRQQ